MRRTFTDDDGKMALRYTSGAITEVSVGGMTIGTKVEPRATLAERWSALATACEAHESTRAYGRRIRHYLGTVAGID